MPHEKKKPRRAKILAVLGGIVVAVPIVLAFLQYQFPDWRWFGDSNRYDARLETVEDSTRLMNWLYDHYGEVIDLKIEFDDQRLGPNSSLESEDGYVRVGLISEECGSWDGSGGVDTYRCGIPSEVILAFDPVDSDEPIELHWNGGGRSGWNISGRFRVADVGGPQQGTWFIALDEQK
ncbi:MAG: hypothetical protein ACOC84_09900 [Actinomycetota bacterium]